MSEADAFLAWFVRSGFGAIWAVWGLLVVVTTAARLLLVAGKVASS